MNSYYATVGKYEKDRKNFDICSIDFMCLAIFRNIVFLKDAKITKKNNLQNYKVFSFVSDKKNFYTSITNNILSSQP